MSARLPRKLCFLGQVSPYSPQYKYWGWVILFLFFIIQFAVPCSDKARSHNSLQLLSSIFSGKADLDTYRCWQGANKDATEWREQRRSMEKEMDEARRLTQNTVFLFPCPLGMAGKQSSTRGKGKKVFSSVKCCPLETRRQGWSFCPLTMLWSALPLCWTSETLSRWVKVKSKLALGDNTLHMWDARTSYLLCYFPCKRETKLDHQ